MMKVLLFIYFTFNEGSEELIGSSGYLRLDRKQSKKLRKLLKKAEKIRNEQDLHLAKISLGIEKPDIYEKLMKGIEQ